MKRWKLKLAQKISLMVVALIIAAVVVSTWISGNWYIERMMDHIRQNTLNAVVITAKSPIIIEGLIEKRQDGSIQKFVQDTQEALEQIDIMVVADKDGVRYGHTKNDRIGKLFSAEDHDRAIYQGETYVSIGPGTLGDSLRAFTPVISEDGEILGFVMAGTLLDSIAEARRTITFMMVGFILLGSAVGIGGAVFLSYYIKKSLLSYEPEDISRLYLENQGILATIHEGVIAIDKDSKITLINEAAKQYLRLNDACRGEAVQEIFPLSRLPEVVQTGEAQLDVQYALGDRIVISNNIPIADSGGQIIGGVSSFRDQTEMNKLAEEITGVNKIVDSLRATTHEFKNKLHVILGLIETRQLDRAKSYIGETNEELQATVSTVLNHILDPTLSALCIGKSQRCHELKIKWILNEDTYFTNEYDFDVNSLVVIVGNLIDNGAEHLEQCGKEEKDLELYINDEQDALVIWVRDSGQGIADPSRIFEKGYTTKQGSRGYGLYLVKEQVDKYQGQISVETKPGVGSRFYVTLKKENR